MAIFHCYVSSPEGNSWFVSGLTEHIADALYWWGLLDFALARCHAMAGLWAPPAGDQKNNDGKMCPTGPQDTKFRDRLQL